MKFYKTEIRHRLESKRDQLQNQIREKEHALKPVTGINPDHADLASDYTNRSRQSAYLRRYQNQLDEVEQALTRLEKGSYGVCIQCGNAIQPERLEILPYAAYCMACQEND